MVDSVRPTKARRKFLRQMQLSKAQLLRFRNDGCIWFEGFFTPRETRALRLELERIYDVELKHGTGINCAVQENGTKRDNYGERQNLQVIPLNNRSDLHKALIFNAKVLSVVEQLIGGRFHVGTGSSLLETAQDRHRYKLASGQRLLQDCRPVARHRNVDCNS